MNAAATPVELSPEDAHAKAREALTDAFFWDTEDAGAPFGNDTGREVLEALRDARVEDPGAISSPSSSELLARWEIADEHWDTVSEAEIEALGADDELGLIVRDEAILALAFGQLIEEGRIDAEVRRRALLALARQALPALLHGSGALPSARRKRVERMREILAQRWD